MSNQRKTSYDKLSGNTAERLSGHSHRPAGGGAPWGSVAQARVFPSDGGRSETGAMAEPSDGEDADATVAADARLKPGATRIAEHIRDTSHLNLSPPFAPRPRS
jgi:hypothetical protein